MDERLSRRKDLYLKTQNAHKRHKSMPPAGFEPIISALDRAATGTTACLEQVFSFTISQHGNYWPSKDTLT